MDADLEALPDDIEALKVALVGACGFRADRARHSDLMPPTIPI